jgi:hypothetical protein
VLGFLVLVLFLFVCCFYRNPGRIALSHYTADVSIPGICRGSITTSHLVFPWVRSGMGLN